MSSVTVPLSGLKGWIVGLTSVLVVLPALINAGHDLYLKIEDLPSNESERTNLRMFQKYFGKQPVVSLPLPIKHSLGTVDSMFSVYEGGDVLVEYGQRTQWLPFPIASLPKDKLLFFVGNAYAQANQSSRGIGSFRQSDRIEGRVLIRERRFENGVVEVQRIDTHTGEVLSRTSKPSAI